MLIRDGFRQIKQKAATSTEKGYITLQSRSRIANALSTATITDPPAILDHFAHCNEINRRGQTLTHNLPGLKDLEPINLLEQARETRVQVLNVRGYESYSGQHSCLGERKNLDMPFASKKEMDDLIAMQSKEIT